MSNATLETGSNEIEGNAAPAVAATDEGDANNTIQQAEFTPKAPGCAFCYNALVKTEQTPVSCDTCRSIKYCSVKCRTSDKQDHAVTCRVILNDKQYIPELSETFLFDREEQEVFMLLVDAYRLRSDDDYRAKRFRHRNSFYRHFDKYNAMAGFRTFLREAQKIAHPGTLPDWWSKSKAAECQEFAAKLTKDKAWGDLAYPVDNHDMIVHYGCFITPLQLRLLGDSLTGNAQVTSDFKRFWAISMNENGTTVRTTVSANKDNLTKNETDNETTPSSMASANKPTEKGDPDTNHEPAENNQSNEKAETNSSAK